MSFTPRKEDVIITKQSPRLSLKASMELLSIMNDFKRLMIRMINFAVVNPQILNPNIEREDIVRLEHFEQFEQSTEEINNLCDTIEEMCEGDSNQKLIS